MSKAGSLARWPSGVFAPALAVFLLSLSLGCGDGGGAAEASAPPAAEPEPKPEPAIAVAVLPVTQAALSAVYSTSTTLRADKKASVTARTSGVVRSIQVEEGDDVVAGQELMILEDHEQRIEHDKATATYETKRREFERAERLHDQGLLSEEEYERVRREHEEARQNAAMSELVLSRTRILAPFRGRVLVRHLDIGATVSDGTAVFDLADLDPLYTDVNVPERHVHRVVPGQRVQLTADASGEQATARVERIAPFVDTTTGTVKVTLAVRGSARLKPGSFVRVEIETDTHAEALVVPRSALVAEGQRWYLFRLNSDGERVERLEIERGYEDRDRVEVLNTVGDPAPLAAGQAVVVVGAAALTDEARVEVLEPDAAQDEAAGAAA